MLALSFLAPSRLWLLLLPILLAAYVVSQVRRRGYVVASDGAHSVAPGRGAAPPGHRAPARAGRAVALAGKPAVAGGRQAGVVVLAMDTSLSMEATDVAPSAWPPQDAARTFLKNVPNGVRVGL